VAVATHPSVPSYPFLRGASWRAIKAANDVSTTASRILFQYLTSASLSSHQFTVPIEGYWCQQNVRTGRVVAQWMCHVSSLSLVCAALLGPQLPVHHVSHAHAMARPVIGHPESDQLPEQDICSYSGTDHQAKTPVCLLYLCCFGSTTSNESRLSSDVPECTIVCDNSGIDVCYWSAPYLPTHLPLPLGEGSSASSVSCACGLRRRGQVHCRRFWSVQQQNRGHTLSYVVWWWWWESHYVLQRHAPVSSIGGGGMGV